MSDRHPEPTLADIGPPQQAEMPFAIISGEPHYELPKDLYIPPDALEVILDVFEGPLDLLLYLIRRQNLDILDIPIADITHQYVAYIEMMQNMRLELAADYLLMAAMLAEIKSRMLLPRINEEDDEEGDPRAELIRRLQEYERYKQAAEDIDALPRMGRDLFQVDVELNAPVHNKKPVDVDLKELLLAMKEVLQRADLYGHHQIQLEPLSVRERMSQVLAKLKSDHFVEFSSLFEYSEGRLGVVVTFLALLELIKESMVDMVQEKAYASIHVKARAAVEQDATT
ncbi:MAG: segregation/condensation protein A [gamma proteobacterium symbiont of Bathyaustriella thionipta]|nr:segregation/condensation protein A [gamma proteobacterium symbiont of Bathyaustriella thionipta]